MSEQQSISIEAAPRFQRNLRKLANKYPMIRNDIEPIIAQLQQGEILGDPIPKKSILIYSYFLNKKHQTFTIQNFESAVGQVLPNFHI